jgi:hypothetical protein
MCYVQLGLVLVLVLVLIHFTQALLRRALKGRNCFAVG